MIYGNAGNNLLNGDAGADPMVGGAGNDTYFVDKPATWCSRTQRGHRRGIRHRALRLAANVETLVLQGSADLQGYGNNQANTIYGNAGKNLSTATPAPTP